MFLAPTLTARASSLQRRYVAPEAILDATVNIPRRVVGQSDVKIARERRRKLIDATLEVLTGEEAYHFGFVASVFGSKKLLDEVIAGAEKDLKEELLVALFRCDA
jgi:hypothetical protein